MEWCVKKGSLAILENIPVDKIEIDVETSVKMISTPDKETAVQNVLNSINKSEVWKDRMSASYDEGERKITIKKLKTQ